MVWPFSKTVGETAVSVDDKSYDYVIVGGGTAACALASRLSEDPAVTVLVISRGSAADSWLFRAPLAAQLTTTNTPEVILVDAEPNDKWDGTASPEYTSQAVGGATRIHGSGYWVGTPGNYNLWAEMGNDQWSWDKCAPFFRKQEDASLSRSALAKRGQDGPLTLRSVTSTSGFTKYYKQAAKKVGLPVFPDGNYPDAPATGLYDLEATFDASGNRLTAMGAYLPPSVLAERSERLTLCTNAIATKIEFSEDGSTATGVRLVDAGSKGKTARECLVKARREVIVSCGAMFSPQVLMLSGVGARQELEAHSIPVVHDLPGVGKNLKNHVSFGISIQVLLVDSMLQIVSPLFLLWHFMLWVCTRTGILSTPFPYDAAWVNTKLIDDETMTIKADESSLNPYDTGNIPDVEVMMMHTSFDLNFTKGKGYSGIYLTLATPHSTGSIALGSSDPLALPKMHHPYITDPRDWAVARKAARFAANYLEQSRSDDYPFKTVWHRCPGMEEDSMSGTWKDMTDAQIDEFVKKHLGGTHHLTSTCRMGKKEDGGVVGQDLKVHGVRNLRVVDASVFPMIPSAHTCAATYMVAERAAEFIKEEWKGKSA